MQAGLSKSLFSIGILPIWKLLNGASLLLFLACVCGFPVSSMAQVLLEDLPGMAPFKEIIKEAKQNLPRNADPNRIFIGRNGQSKASIYAFRRGSTAPKLGIIIGAKHKDLERDLRTSLDAHADYVLSNIASLHLGESDLSKLRVALRLDAGSLFRLVRKFQKEHLADNPDCLKMNRNEQVAVRRAMEEVNANLQKFGHHSFGLYPKVLTKILEAKLELEPGKHELLDLRALRRKQAFKTKM